MIQASDSPALSSWLARLEQRAPVWRIELGLERVAAVWRRMGVRLSMPIISVAGTNGKGSVVAMIESMLIAGGYRPLAYSSPHIRRFSERMRLNGKEADDRQILSALENVERAREEAALSYFEHVTLAALSLAARAQVDAAVLEVGLGGRLDAVNVVDADVAVITSIGVDHAEFLGASRDLIAREKAGIARSGRPVVIGEPEPPPALCAALRQAGAHIIMARDRIRPGGWPQTLRLALGGQRLDLPPPALAGDWQRDNAACAVIALHELSARLPLSPAALAEGLRRVRLPGRFQIVQRRPDVVLDVAHNPAAAAALATALGPARSRSTAVFSAQTGKDVAGIGRALDACFTHWLCAPLEGYRGRAAGDLAAELQKAPVAGRVKTVESVAAALDRALASSGSDDRIVVFGSFRTVAEAWPEQDFSLS